MLKKIFESTVIMGASSIMVMALDVVRVKILAVLLGPSGVGTISVLSHFHALAVTLTKLGLGPGIAKYVSSYVSQQNNTAAQKILSNAFQMTLLTSAAITAFSIIWAAPISKWILDTREFHVLVAVYAVSIPLAAYSITTASFLGGLKKIRQLASINVFRGLLTFCFIVPLVYWFGLIGAAISVFPGTLIQCMLNAWYLKKDGRSFRALTITAFDRKMVSDLLQYGMTSLLVGMVFDSTHLILKIIIVNELGVTQNGIYQPVWALTMNYLTLVLSSMSTYSYPRLCELTEKRDICEELNAIIRISVLLITPLMFLLLVFKEQVILLLYGRSFIDAAQLMPIQIFGDFFKLMAYCQGMYLLPMKYLRDWTIACLLQSVFMVVCSWFVIGSFGLEGVAFSFTASYFLSWLYMFWHARHSLGFSFWQENRVLVLLSLAGVGIIGFTADFINSYMYYALSAVTIVLWAMLVVKRDEYKKFLEYVHSKYTSVRGRSA